MRTSAIVISAILGAGALAHPFHLHNKREDQSRGKLVKTYRQGNRVIKEYETVQKFVVHQGSSHQPAANNEDTTPAKPMSSPAPAQPSPVASPAEQPVVEMKNTQEQKEDKVSNPPANNPNTPEASSSPVTTGGSTTDSSDSGMLATVNDMRDKWAGLPNYQWSSTLASNSQKTLELDGGFTTGDDGEPSPVGCKMATRMGHKLFSGSFGQCLAGHNNDKGDEDFKAALTMWMCEIKKGFCTAQTTGSGDGHAKILQDTGHTHIGCAFMWANNDSSSGKGVWSCDFGKA